MISKVLFGQILFGVSAITLVIVIIIDITKQQDPWLQHSKKSALSYKAWNSGYYVDELVNDSWIISSDENKKELQRFNTLMQNWPIHKLKAAIYFLCHPQRIVETQEALIRLDNNFLYKYKYPIIIFHEQNFLEKSKNIIRNVIKADFFFQEINMTTPQFLTDAQIPPLDYCVHRPVSYRHMCRFNALKVYEQPILRGLEYYWRLDTDSMIVRQINYDVFQRMKRNNKVHGYIWIKNDLASCVLGLWNASRTYCSRQNLTPIFFDSWPDTQVYFNNFEISRMDFWLSAAVQKFLHHIDHLGGIYYLRWGDNPIKAITVSIFLSAHQTLYFDDIGYKHKQTLVRL